MNKYRVERYNPFKHEWIFIKDFKTENDAIIAAKILEETSDQPKIMRRYRVIKSN